MRVLVLEMSGKDVTVLFVDPLHGGDPFALAVRVIARAGTLDDAKVLGDQLVWAEVIFLHVGFTVGVVFGKVSAVYHPTIVATDTTENKCEAIVAIETPFERSRLAHKSAPSFTVIGERCKEASLSQFWHSGKNFNPLPPHASINSLQLMGDHYKTGPKNEGGSVLYGS